MMTAERLKGSLLQMAMQGKLVEQRSEEGTGNELLRGVKRSEIIDSDTQENLIEIPDNWCWVQLGDFCELYTGNSISESVKKAKYMKDIEGYPYIATKDVQFDNSVDYSNGVIIPYEEEFRHACNGSVLMCIEGGSAGRKIALIDRDVCFGNKLCMFNSSIAYNRFVYYYLQSPVFKNGFKDGITGIIGGVSIKKLKKMWMPLAPLEEQKRIVAKIEELMPFVEQYAAASTKLNALNTSFPDMMKKSILQEAVQGKLVPQDPNDEPASELLKRITEEKQRLIKEGKIKKQKALPAITEDEIPFDIPESWEWVRLSELGELQTGTTPSKSHKEFFGTDIPFVSPGDITSENELICREYGLSFEGIEHARLIKAGSVMQVCIGGSIGKAAINNIDVTCNQQINTITPFLFNVEYLFYCMTSDYFVGIIKANAGGTATPIINKTSWGSMLVPVPPLAEQVRIVEALRLPLSSVEELKEIPT